MTSSLTRAAVISSGLLLRYSLIRKVTRRLGGILISSLPVQTAAQEMCRLLIERDLLRHAPEANSRKLFAAIVQQSSDEVMRQLAEIVVDRSPEIVAADLASLTASIAAAQLVSKMVKSSPELAERQLVQSIRRLP
jgi:hypothetical protein